MTDGFEYRTERVRTTMFGDIAKAIDKATQRMAKGGWELHSSTDTATLLGAHTATVTYRRSMNHPAARKGWWSRQSLGRKLFYLCFGLLILAYILDDDDPPPRSQAPLPAPAKVVRKAGSPPEHPQSEEDVEGEGADGAPARPGATPEPEAQTTVWDDPTTVRFAGRDCPDTMWAVIRGYNTGQDEFESRRLEEQRSRLSEQVRDATYVVKLSASELDLGEYGFRKKAFPVKVDAIFKCRASFMLALGKPRISKMAEQMRSGKRYTYHEWDARPLKVSLPIPEGEAQAFMKKAEGGLLSSGTLKPEVAFRVTGGRIDRKHNRFLDDDVGAGPVVLTRLLGVRVLSEQGDVLVDTARVPKPAR